MQSMFASPKSKKSKNEPVVTRARGGGTTSGGDHTKMVCRNVSVFYEDFHALKDVTIDVNNKEVLALMGPSGCGKSTFLRCLNRMNDTVDGARITGEVLLEGMDIYDPNIDPVLIRSRIGMVAQAPNPFPKSIYDNVAFGPRLHGLYDRKQDLDELVEKSLRRAGLWDEVKDILERSGTGLSGGQQQRLCIARAIANGPDVLLMDEPVSALDPVAAGVIERLIGELAERYAIVIITHSLEQAHRIADRTAFFYLGELVETGATEDVFNNPKDKRTKHFIEGMFG